MGIRKPSNWNTFTVYQKMGYLVNTNQARNFSEAASILSNLRRPKAQPQPIKTSSLPYADN